ncbi:MAG: 4-hydroxy-tetrahydrodipicolinate synthase [Candidatus Methanomethylophilaceae archaeon]|nr:4-hydroxy-tetrahydrodipicolinate synthase [Candidatus Methanomethylophilaceae archaeon]
MFSGTATALITPFHKDGSIDEQGLRELVEYQEEQGVEAVVPCGSTGESATLSHDEHIEVIRIVMNHVKRVKVIAGAGSNSTQEAIDLSRRAADLGVDGVLSISPYYNKPTQEGIYRHYKAISEAISVPLIPYNVPGRTGSNMSAQTTLRLAELPNVAAIKEASGDVDQVMTILANRPKDFCVLSGDDALTFAMLAMGGSGVISVSSNCAPRLVGDMVRTAISGDLVKAREMHFRLLPLFRVLFREPNPIPVKAAMRMMGKPSGTLRLPLMDMSPLHEEELRSVLQGLGLV